MHRRWLDHDFDHGQHQNINASRGIATQWPDGNRWSGPLPRQLDLVYNPNRRHLLQGVTAGTVLATRGTNAVADAPESGEFYGIAEIVSLPE